MSRLRLVLAPPLALLLVAGCGLLPRAGSATPSATGSVSARLATSAPEPAVRTWAIGDTVEARDGGERVLFLVRGVQAPYDPGNASITPDRGLFLSVSMTVLNASPRALAFTFLDFDVRDEAGRVFKPSLFTRGALSGEVPAGETMAGTWMFDIERGHTYRLHFRPFEGSHVEVVVDLGRH